MGKYKTWIFACLFMYGIVAYLICFLPAQAQAPSSANSIVAWSPNGQHLALSGRFGIKLYTSTLANDVVLQGATNTVNFVAWSPDSTKLASANANYSVQIWNILTGLLQTTLQGHTQSVSSVSWSPDGSKLASVAGDSTVRIWDTTTGQILSVIHNSASVNAIAWSPDGAKIAGGSDGARTIYIWDANTTNLLSSFPSDPVGRIDNSLFWSSDNRYLITEGPSIWDIGTGQDISSDTCSAGSSTAATWSSDGNYTADAGISSEGGTACIFNRVAGPPPIFIDFPNQEITSVAFSPDDNLLAATDGPGWVFIVDVKTGNKIASRPSPLSTNKDLPGLVRRCVMTDNAHHNSLVSKAQASQFQSLVSELSAAQTEPDNNIQPDCVSDVTTLANYLASRPAATNTPLPQQLQLIPLCSDDPSQHRVWRVQNLNPYDVAFSWNVLNATPEQYSEEGVVPAAIGGTPGSQTFNTVTESDPDTVQLFSPSLSGDLQDTEANALGVCPTSTSISTLTPTSQ